NNETDEYTITQEFVNFIERELISRDRPDNEIDSLKILIRNNVNDLNFVVSRRKIENILVSIFNNGVVKTKRSGTQAVQVPSTGYERTGREYSDNGLLKSNELKFY